MAYFEFLIPSEMSGQTVMQIARNAMLLSNRQFKSAKYHGKMHLDDVEVYSNQVVSEGQRLCIITPDGETQHYEPLFMTLNIPYEDEHIIIVDKPAYLPSVPAPKKATPTLANAIYAHLGCPSHFVYRAINRLDKGTSGLMTIAKTAHAQQRLQLQLHQPTFMRKYLAVVDGCFPHCKGVIHAPIAKVDGATIMREVSHRGKQAITHFQCLYVKNQRSLIELVLETGRTHQIRVHMSSLGYPLVGDFCYGRETEELPLRFALHSATLQLNHPISNEQIIINSPLPDELAKLFEKER